MQNAKASPAAPRKSAGAPRRARRNANLISLLLIASLFLAVAGFVAAKTHDPWFADPPETPAAKPGPAAN